MVSSELWFGAEASFYNGVATQSLRFNDPDSSVLSRTPSSSGNRQVWTVSFWIKRTKLAHGQGIASTYTGSPATANTQWSWESDDAFMFYDYHSSYQWRLKTNRLFRDVGSWYHIVLAVDTTQATSSNRIKIYVNGEQETSFSAETYPSQNLNTADWNTTQTHYIGRHSTLYLDGYMAEFNNIDGLQLDPTYFGESKFGTWIPKEYTGSYGTNGFRLQFNQTGTGTASSSTIGADTSGNNNHFTSSGISDHDCNMPDSPENNFATLNPLYATENAVFSEGNLRLDYNSGTFNSSGSTIATGSMKFYTEVLLINSTVNPAESSIGISNADKFSWNTDNAHSATGNNGVRYQTQNGNIENGYGTNGTGATLTSGDILGIACDPINGTLAYYKNGSLQDTVNIDTGLFYAITMSDASRFTNDVDFVVNFGQDSSFSGNKTAQGNTDANGIGDFYYSVPSDFLALCTANLPEPTISPNSATQADDHFNTVIWTGNGTNPRTISGVGFQPDWVWHKPRNLAYNHLMWDSSRGVGSNSLLTLFPNLTNAESDSLQSQGNATSFDSDGFIVNAGSSGDNHVNDASYNYVAWNWKANGGTTSSNTDGSITSTVQANTTAGFSIVTFTGTGSNATVGHGLSVAPTMIIFKNRDNSYSWSTYVKEIDASYRLTLEQTSGRVSSSTSFNSTDPTSSVFSVGTNVSTNKSGDKIIAYCFHSVDGYSKIGGSYVGNGSTDGTFVFTGFRPAWIMTKETSNTSTWNIYDNVRSDDNPATELLIANSYNAEGTGTDIDIVSNGFKVRSSSGNINTSGNNYIYIAFAHMPFKYALAR